MKTSGESYGNLTRAIKETLRLKWLLRKSQTLASLPVGTAASWVLLPPATIWVWVQLATGRTLSLLS